jgi:F-type H+-transporting ATPase subunit a
VISILSYIRILAEADPLEPVLAVPLFTFQIWGRQILVSNHMFMVTVATLLLIIGIPLAMRSKSLVPSGFRNLIESVCVYIREQVAKPVLHEHTDRYIGFVWTVFFFILSLNLLGMIPSEKIITLITGKKNHFGGPATANIWVTGAMAVVAFMVTHVSGIREQGLWRYIVNIAPPVPWYIMWLIYPLEVISMFVKPFTLAVRLFANIVGGHMVIATFIGLILAFKRYDIAGCALAFALFSSVLDLLVAFIQAFVFALLTTVYIGSSIAPEH